MKKYVFTLLLAGMMVVMTACGNNMNDATGGNQNDTVNDSTTNDNGTTKDDTMNNDRNNNDRNNNGDGVIGDIGEDITRTVRTRELEKTSVMAWKISVKD